MAYFIVIVLVTENQGYRIEDRTALFAIFYLQSSNSSPFSTRFLAAGLDADDFRFEGYAEQGVDQPVHHQRTGFWISNRVTLAFENVEQFGRGDFAHELI